MIIRTDKVLRYIFPLVVLLVGVLYYFVSPSLPLFPIKCPWHWLTGTQCPACGFQRALHTLVHGDLLAALRYNYFFILSIPYAFLVVLAGWYNINHVFDKLARVVFHRVTLWIYIAMFFIWWVLRNLLGI
ncbi:MAG: DUF2752 domain-containing protein [Paludibacteraceae bacterium]|nr:DUF2752 domain-containing protein [Paludibacteraceae bacterium]